MRVQVKVTWPTTVPGVKVSSNDGGVGGTLVGWTLGLCGTQHRDPGLLFSPVSLVEYTQRRRPSRLSRTSFPTPPVPPAGARDTLGVTESATWTLGPASWT